MRIEANGTVHLTYCSNIHPAESWRETHENIRVHAVEVKARSAPGTPFGLGLRLSARAASELLAAPGALAALRAELDDLGMYVFTLNGFPYGAFHGVPVKVDVYRPSFREPERVRYTLQLIEILSALLPQGVPGSISTVPIGFRPEFAAPAAREQAAAHLLDCAAALFHVREAQGADIALALEPEPACALETTEEALAFLNEGLFCASALARFGARIGLAPAPAEQALRQHVGLCFDTCHAAVEFEAPRAAVRAIAAAGVRLAKVQATTGLHVEPLDAAQREALAAFADPVYLHQVVARCRAADGSVQLARFLDLDQALASLAAAEHRPECWRVHFHVPVFARELTPFANTQDFLREALEQVMADRTCDQIEVETYTWSVLPERYRLPLNELIAGELAWVERTLRVEARSRARERNDEPARGGP